MGIDLNGMTLEEKQKLWERLKEKETLEKDRVLEKMEFSPIQRLFLQCTKKVALILAANRSGKTTVLTAGNLIRMTGLVPESIKDIYPKENIRHGEYWMSGLDFVSITDVLEKKMNWLMPKRMDDGYNRELKRQKLTCGCEVRYKSNDSGREKYQGASKLGFYEDEEHSEAVHNEGYMRTIDCSGVVRMGFTPAKGMTWAHRKIYQKAARYNFTVNVHGIPEDTGIIHTKDEIKKLKDRKVVTKENPSPEADEDIEVFQMTIYDNPFLPDAEIQRAEKENAENPAIYNARVLGGFARITGKNVFPVNYLMQKQRELNPSFIKGTIDSHGMFQKQVRGNLTLFKKPKDLLSSYYVIGADVAEGLDEGDYSCAQILDHKTFEQIGIWHGKCSPDEFAEVLSRLGRFFNYAWVAPERNFHGFGVVEALKNVYKYRRLYSNYEPVLEQGRTVTHKKYGWETTAKTKPIMIQGLGRALKTETLKLNDLSTVDELITYVYDKNGRTTAMGGCFDDRVIALGIAYQVAKTRKPKPFRRL